MANLAGFDIVAEIHLDTITDFVNANPVTNPIDGSSVYLLGGPFTTTLQIDLGGLGMVGVAALVNFTLQPLQFQSTAQMLVSLDGGTFGPGPLSAVHVIGTATIDVAIGFFDLPQQGPILIWRPNLYPHDVYPVLMLDRAETSVALEHGSHAQIDAAIGKGGGLRVENALAHALRDWIRKQGTRTIEAVKFRVVPGVDSVDVAQLSAAPVAAWIDNATLGIYGYYRAAASGGDVTTKTDSHIRQYFYGAYGARVEAGRRIAMLIAAEWFHRLVVCPTVIRDNIIEGLYYRQEFRLKRGYWMSQIFGTVEDPHDEELKTLRTKYQMLLGVFAAIEKVNAMVVIQQNPHMDAEAQALEFTKAGVKASGEALAGIQDELDRLTGDRLNAYLKTDKGKLTADGLREVTAVTPQPCGSGEVELFRYEVPSPLPDILGIPNPMPDIVPMLQELELTPDDEFLKLRFVTGGNFELITGDIAYKLTAEFSIKIAIDTASNISTDVQPLSFVPDVDPNSLTKVYLDFVSDYATSPQVKAFCWQVAMAIADVIETRLTAALNAAAADLLDSVGGFPAQLADFQADPASVAVIAAISRRMRWNDLDPGVTVKATTVSRAQSSQRATYGTLHLERTAWGCPEADFDYSRSFWDTTVAIRAIPRDLPPPFSFSGWRIEIGHVGPAISGAPLLWGETPAPIAAGAQQISGVIHHLEPPLDGVDDYRTDIAVDASGGNDLGWTLKFHGKYGNFYVHVTMQLTDGDGKQWPGAVYFAIQGEQLDMLNPFGYNAYKTACAAKYKLWSIFKFGHAVEIMHVGPGDRIGVDIGDPIIREAGIIRTLAAAGDPAVGAHIAAAAQKFGDKFFQALGNAQRGTITPPQKTRPG